MKWMTTDWIDKSILFAVTIYFGDTFVVRTESVPKGWRQTPIQRAYNICIVVAAFNALDLEFYRRMNSLWFVVWKCYKALAFCSIFTRNKWWKSNWLSIQHTLPQHYVPFSVSLVLFLLTNTISGNLKWLLNFEVAFDAVLSKSVPSCQPLFFNLYFQQFYCTFSF